MSCTSTERKSLSSDLVLAAASFVAGTNYLKLIVLKPGKQQRYMHCLKDLGKTHWGNCGHTYLQCPFRFCQYPTYIQAAVLSVLWAINGTCAKCLLLINFVLLLQVTEKGTVLPFTGIIE